MRKISNNKDKPREEDTVKKKISQANSDRILRDRNMIRPMLLQCYKANGA